MEQLGCKHVTRAVVRVGDRLVVGYSHFGHIQACQNASRKIQQQGGRK